jgi:hypothetical protein
MSEKIRCKAMARKRVNNRDGTFGIHLDQCKRFATVDGYCKQHWYLLDSPLPSFDDIPSPKEVRL